jgi:hypothetical protein
MAQLIGCSIDVTKIDKSKLVDGKNGAKYFNFNISVEDEPNQFGKDCSITLPQSKEERDAKAKRVFIGSGKTLWRSTKQHQTVAPQTQETGGNDLPF